MRLFNLCFMNTAKSISINEYSLNTVTLSLGNTFQSLIVNQKEMERYTCFT